METLSSIIQRILCKNGVCLTKKEAKGIANEIFNEIIEVLTSKRGIKFEYLGKILVKEIPPKEFFSPFANKYLQSGKRYKIIFKLSPTGKRLLKEKSKL